MVSRLLHILLAFIVTLPAWGRVDTRTGMLNERIRSLQVKLCLLYTSDAADD